MSASIPDSTLEKFTTFGDLLRYLRRASGLTQLELSIQVGYSHAQISRLEQNLRLPDIPTIEARFVPALGLEHEPKAVARLLELAANVRREDAPGLGLCPYKGLNYFDESDADLFVGREALTAKLTERVHSLISSDLPTETRFLAIVGASGSGKSSLVRAGLVPALRWNKKSADWHIHIFTPTAHPLEGLAVSLTSDSDSVIATSTLMDDLARDPRSLQIFVKRQLSLENHARALLVIDQFEELFALCRSEEERASFIGNLLAAASEADGPVIVLITLRADFYAHCANYIQLREALAQNQEYIGAMNDEELCRAIEEPARRGRWELESGLVDLLLHDVGHEPGALPLLSHALYETWQRRRGRTLTLSGYTSSGGVRGAIAETAETVFTDQFTREQRAIARRIFLRLTELSDEAAAADTRRRATFNELILKPEEASTTHAVLKTLADARLITTSEDSAEVAHEALIREWPTLQGWLEENREGLRLHRQLTEAAQEWLEMDRALDVLYRGARLAQAREWASTHEEELNTLEREFLAASIGASEREIAEREAQRQRELEAAQTLAEAQRQRAEAEKQRAEMESQRAEEQVRTAVQLRKRALYLAMAFTAALIMALTALFFGARAREAALTAQAQQRVAFSRELAAASISNLDVDPERSLLLALEAVSVTYSVDNSWTAESEDALRSSLLDSRVELTIRGHSQPAVAIAFSPDGTRFATASDDGTAKIWDSTTGHELLTLTTNASGGHHGMAFSPDGRRLATAGENGIAKVWDAATGQELLTLHGHTDWISSIVFSPDGTRLATSSEDRTAKVWDAGTGQEIMSLQGHAGAVWAVAFSPDGTRLATTGQDAKIKVWDAVTGEESFTLSGLLGSVSGVVFSPDGKFLATGGGDETARIWDLATRRNVLTLRGHAAWVANITYSPDGMRLATASFDGKVKVWDAHTGQDLLTLTGHTGPVVGVAFSPDCVSTPHALAGQCGTRLATTSLDGTTKVWNTSPSRELLTFWIPDGADQIPHYSRDLNPDGTLLATGFSDGSVKVWDISSPLSGNGENGKDVLTLHGHTAAVNGVSFSPEGSRLATTSSDGTIKIWDVLTGKQLLTLRGHAGEVYDVAFSPEGTRLVTSSSDSTIRVWDVLATINKNLTGETDQALLTIPVPVLTANVTFSPDGMRVAASSQDGIGRVWDATTGQELLSLRGHTAESYGVTFNPDGTRLATASDDGTAIVWDAATGQPLLTLRGHTGWVTQVSFSPNGTRLATVGQDSTTRLWDATTGQELLTLRGHTSEIVTLAFSPMCDRTAQAWCGTRLFTASVDGTVRFYLTRMEDLLTLAHTRVTRSLTTEECQRYLHLDLEQCSQGSAPLTQVPPAATLHTTVAALSPTVDSKICQVTDETGVNDQFFNQKTYEGVMEASERFGWEAVVVESQQPDDYRKNMGEFVQGVCDLIITPPFSFADITKVTAETYPDRKFLIMDLFYDPPLDNVRGQIYAVDQAAFLAGYVAASMTKTGKVATFGGFDLPPVTDFMDGFVLGVAYYNEKNGTEVEVLGWDVEKRSGLFTGDFVSIDAGRRVGEQLLNEGADIILPVAGDVGLGTAAVVQERGNAYLIGVDTDWAETFPEYANIMLTSVEKRMDVSVVHTVQAIVEETFTGGTHIGTLETGEVGLAPFYAFDSLISDKVKADLEQIKADIIGGKIKTKP